MDDPPPPSLVGCQALDQFLLLAKTVKGPAVAELITVATGAPGVYVFGELLECECVRSAATGPHARSVELLEIFAYGTYGDYKQNRTSLPSLSHGQLTKLKHLTVVSLASQCRVIQYSTLLNELDISDLRELEDLIIGAIYTGIIQAKLDQKNAQLEVESFIGRDIKPEAVADMVVKLENWCTNCTLVLQSVEEQIQRANLAKMEHRASEEQNEVEQKQLRETLKVASTMEDQVGQVSQLKEPMRPSLKKGIRGSATHIKMLGKK